MHVLSLLSVESRILLHGKTWSFGDMFGLIHCYCIYQDIIGYRLIISWAELAHWEKSTQKYPGYERHRYPGYMVNVIGYWSRDQVKIGIINPWRSSIKKWLHYFVCFIRWRPMRTDLRWCPNIFAFLCNQSKAAFEWLWIVRGRGAPGRLWFI